jgi:hypothetical protein
MLVILQPHEDKYVIKIHSTRTTEKGCRPIVKFKELIHRAVAASKTDFLVINTTSTSMYEFSCQTGEERRRWLTHLTRATEEYKKLQSELRQKTTSAGGVVGPPKRSQLPRPLAQG